MWKTIASILGRIGLTLLCVLVPSMIMAQYKTRGIIVGGLLATLIHLPSMYLIWRIWKKPVYRKPASPEVPIDEPAEKEEEAEESNFEAPRIVRRRTLASAAGYTDRRTRYVIIALSVLCVLSLVTMAYFAFSASGLRSELAARATELEQTKTNLVNAEVELEASKDEVASLTYDRELLRTENHNLRTSLNREIEDGSWYRSIYNRGYDEGFIDGYRACAYTK